MKKLKKIFRNNKKLLSVIGIVILLIIIIVLAYKIFFSSSGSNRYEGIKSHELTKSEISDVKKIIDELGEVSSSKVYVDSKIIRIFVTLKRDVDFDELKDIANRTTSKISKDNLKYYDLEFFVDSKDSEIYPQIGYKHKSSDKFVW